MASPRRAAAPGAAARRSRDTEAVERALSGYDAGRLAWRAWALSRVLDVLQVQPGVDARRVLVGGHSRNRKTALLAAAFDDRFAGVVASSSGVLGAVPARLCTDRHFGEGVELLTRHYPGWYSPRLRWFAGREHRLPTDAHELLALGTESPGTESPGTESPGTESPGTEPWDTGPPGTPLRPPGAVPRPRAAASAPGAWVAAYGTGALVALHLAALGGVPVAGAVLVAPTCADPLLRATPRYGLADLLAALAGSPALVLDPAWDPLAPRGAVAAAPRAAGVPRVALRDWHRLSAATREVVVAWMAQRAPATAPA